MPIFNSLGSNYSASAILSSFSIYSSRSKQNLIDTIKEHYGAQDVILTYKARQAIYLALMNLGLSKGDGIAVNGYTCFAVYDAITKAGMVPIYVDLAEDSLHFDASGLEKVISSDKNVKAVMIQNTLGFPVEIDSILELCQSKKLPLIEDLAHSIGVKYSNGKEAGTIGDAAVLSFSQDKVVDAVSGGALIWNSSRKLQVESQKLSLVTKLIDRIYPTLTWLIRSLYPVLIGKGIHKLSKSLKLISKPMDGEAGIVQEPSNWHAGLALKQWHKLPYIAEHRRKVAALYAQNLPKDIQYAWDGNAGYVRFPLKLENVQHLKECLTSKGVHITDTWWEAAISPYYALERTNYEKGNCPNSENAASVMLNLPTHIHIDAKKALKITDELMQCLR